MEVVDTTQINSLPSLMQADFLVSPQITVPAQVLQDLLGAVQDLKEEVAALREERDKDRAELAQQIAASEQWQATLSENQYHQLQIIKSLREEVHKETEPSPGEIERIAKIEKLCQDAPGHTISLAELKGRLGIDKAVLSRLLKRIDQDKFYLRKSTLDKRVRYLCLRPEVR